MKNIKFKAFTVSEVLITMLVLGILFSLVAPSIYNSYERNNIQASTIDAFKDFNKATFNYTVQEKAQGNLIITGAFSSGSNPAQALSTFHNGVSKVGKNCWQGLSINSNFDLNGSDISFDDYDCFIDGKNRFWAIESFEDDCSTNLYAGNASKKHKLKNSCGYLILDINGLKGPNAFGRDVFGFVITNATSAYLYPMGGSLAKNIYGGQVKSWQNGACSQNNKDGRSCAGRIMEEGWKVKYLK